MIHADGVWGGTTPRGLVSFAFYNERAAIPRKTKVDLEQSGTALVPTGPEEVVETRGNIVREVEIEVMMDLESASNFHY